jgi:hypothetical protein
MARYSDGFISLADLYLAYRKAKVDAFYETTHHHALAFVEYEQRLYKNLGLLLERLNDTDASWTKDPMFLGGYIDAPRSVGDFEIKDEIHFQALEPLEDWERRFQNSGKKRAAAFFRMLIVPTVNMQVISSLWIIKAGYRFDFRVDRNHSFGNRLRGTAAAFFDEDQEPRLNRECTGLFVPYFSAYRAWRENGLRAMRKALKSGKRVIAVTMDLRQFYQRTAPQFLLRNEFLRAIDLELSQDQRLFTNDLLHAISSWYRATPDYKRRPQGALPVGLSASKIISNVLLCEFDKTIVANLSPIYYGRYVDDIFLVFQPQSDLTSGMEVMKYLSSKSSGMLVVEKTRDGNSGLRLTLPYASDSDLFFAGDKQKIFYLHSDHGLDLVEHISEQIRKQSSEHRLLEDLPDESAEMAARALLATPDATLEADALRKADTVSVRRLGFALLLRDVEAYARDLTPGAWRGLRREFYGLVHRHLLTPKGFFDYAGYLPRVFGLMVACEDFDESFEFLKGFDAVVQLVERTTTAGTKDSPRFALCKQYYVRAFLQGALQASTVAGFTFDSAYRSLLRRLQSLYEPDSIFETASKFRVRSQQILNSDWGRRPYKDFWYYSLRKDAKGPPVPKARDVRGVLRLGRIRRFRRQARLYVPYWPALAFPTRPLSVPEMVLIAPVLLENHLWLRNAIMGLRGARVATVSTIGLVDQPPRDERGQSLLPPSLMQIPAEWKRIRIAVTSVETTERQWRGALVGKRDHSLKRYRRLRMLVNRILEERPRPDYVTFPECSLPRRWALRIAQKLATNGVSLLGGVEYYKVRKKVRNDCLLSLTTNWPGYSSHILLLQPKLEPAHGEARLLKAERLTLYQPNARERTPPVYVHGGLCFGVLLCSDLTNIENRSRFQGQVDALMVLEWNPDVSTFSFLVEATSHDVHAFVVQVNNRMYGDSRIRAPYKEEYRRDSVRVKGGVTDYYVIADIDYLALRAYQRRKPVPRDGEFKPVPIGFEMSDFRRNTGQSVR